MAVRPNFKDTAQLDDGWLKVRGHTAGGLSPLLLQVVVQQDTAAQGNFLDLVPTEWEIHLPAADFHPGPAVALGVETRVYPLETTTWTEAITIV